MRDDKVGWWLRHVLLLLAVPVLLGSVDPLFKTG
jgi:hypothetical protein